MGIEDRRIKLLLILAVAAIFHCTSVRCIQTEEEEFTEELLLKPLPDRKVLAHFHFTHSLPPTKIHGRHHRLFPKAIHQLGFLRIDEYPPDANQGFDLPSAHISFPGFQANRYYTEEESSTSRLLLGFLSKSTVQLYTEVLLLPLATPDFSMPYNVITLTCTVLALYFGSLFNVLRRRIGEEERYLKSKALEGWTTNRSFPLAKLWQQGDSSIKIT